MTEHRKNLIMNVLRVSLDALRKIGVGYIDLEQTDEIHYMIDGKVFVISVKEGATHES